MAITLPLFSENLKSVLHSDGAITDVWKILIDESCAHFIQQNPQNRKDYAEIGKLMFLEYPKIKLEGKYPWVSQGHDKPLCTLKCI